MGWEDQDRDELGRWGSGGGGVRPEGSEGLAGSRPLTASLSHGGGQTIEERNPRQTTPAERAEALADVDNFTGDKLKQMAAEGRMLGEFELMRVTEAISNHLEANPAVLAALKATHVGDRDFGAGEDRYTLSIHESEHLSVYLLRWGPGQQAEWHDHGDGADGARVSVRVLDGPVANDFLGPDGVETLEMEKGKTYYLPAPYIHRMGDWPEDRGAGWSVHAYSGPQGGLDKMTWYEFDPRTNDLTLDESGKPIPKGSWERDAPAQLWEQNPARAADSRGSNRPMEVG